MENPNPIHQDPQHENKTAYFVSYFESVNGRQAIEKSIWDVFQSIKNGVVKDKIIKVRGAKSKEERDNFKKYLPAITTSGTFEGGHASKNLKNHSGLIQIDFDSVSELANLKWKICKDKHTFASFISPSGDGLKVIVKIIPEKHRECFSSLYTYYKSLYGIEIDKKCSDVGRLMFISFDEELFINEDSMVYELTKNSIIDVENVIIKIEKDEKNITPSYEEWLHIGFALTDSFGEAGRSYFHRISRFHPQYEFDKCDAQYDACLKSDGEGIKIVRLFHIAQEHGIEIRTEYGSRRSKKYNSNFMASPQIVKVKEYINEKYDLRLNIVSGVIECKLKEDKEFQQLNENNLYIEIRSSNIKCSQADLLALLRSDFAPNYDPFLHYMEGLKGWDKTTDYINLLCGYITIKGESEEQERFNRHFKKMIVRTVVCALGKNFNKQGFIFMGKQSNGKTTFCRWLCPQQLQNYYTENLGTDKDAHIALCENFIINLDELANFHRTEINSFKSMLSKHAVKVRHPYERKATKKLRRASFFGSTNRDEFLTDETGSVRWLCFTVDKFDFRYKEQMNINDIWSQGYALFLAGFDYQLTTEEIEENERINSLHQVNTIEIELIQKYFCPAKKDDPDSLPVTATEIGIRIKELSGVRESLPPAGIGKALALLGFEKISQRIEGVKHPRKVYFVKHVTQ